MKKPFFIFIILLIITGVAFLIYHFQGSEKYQEKENLLGEQEEQTETFIAKDDFAILLPEGWKETVGPQGVLAMAVYINEEIIDQATEKINFRSYYSVSYDALQGRSLESYAEYIKESLVQLLPGVDFVKEKTVKINSKDAYTIEMEVSQQDVDFKVLMLLIKGEGDDVWLVSFNTTKGYWNEYQDLFQRIAASFEIK